jgi:hypothetical protein
MRTEEPIRFRLQPRPSTGRSIATLLFGIWGVLGFLGSLIGVIELFMPRSVGVGTSAYIGTLATLWIGGMVFFGFCALIASVTYHMVEVHDPRHD